MGFTFNDCTFKGTGTGISVPENTSIPFDINGTFFGCTTGVEVRSTPDDATESLKAFLSKNEISKAEFLDLVREIQIAGAGVNRLEIAKQSRLFKGLSVAADLTGLSNFVVWISMSPRGQQVLQAIFS